jgi:hypothetical protein
MLLEGRNGLSQVLWFTHVGSRFPESFLEGGECQPFKLDVTTLANA